MLQVIKRDGERVDFTLSKINDAIMKAFTATEMQYSNDIVDLLSLRVSADFQDKIKDGAVSVEDIQDSVEKVLGQAGYEDVAKAYILYRKQREKMRTMKSTILDYKDVVNRYLFRRRSYFKQFRRSNSQLLAFRNLRPGNCGCTPQCGYSYP